MTWGSRRRLDSTRRALFDADAAAQLHAFRRWRDESAAALADADAGIDIIRPRCPVLVVAAGLDEAIPTAASRALAELLGATFWLDRCSHVGALLGRPAADTAARALRWIQAETIHTGTSQVPPGTE